MGARRWLLSLALLSAALWLPGEARATEVEVDYERDGHTVCEGDVFHYINVTITNDDAVQSDYDIILSVAGFSFSPGGYSFSLDYGDSYIAPFVGTSRHLSTYKSVQATIQVASSNGENVNEDSPPLVVRACTLGVLLKTGSSYLEGEPGENRTARFNLTSQANFYDIIFLTLEGLPAGWEASLPANLTVEPFGSRLFTLNVTLGEPETVWLRVSASTTYDGVTYEHASSVTITSLSFWERNLGPLLEMLARFKLAIAAVALAGIGGGVWYWRQS